MELCLDTCRQQCGCPLGPNTFTCSNHGTCMNSTCLCDSNWQEEDCSVELFELDQVPYAFVMIMTGSCIIIALLTSILYFFYRHHQIMIYCRPFFGHLMNIGAILGSIALIVAANLRDNDSRCNAIWWLLDYSFVFVFGTLLAKTYRNYRIIRTTKNESLRLSDGWVRKVIGVLLLIETTILVTLLGTNQFNESTSSQEWDQFDGTIERFTGCFLDSRTVIIALVPSKVITIIIVFLLAFKLRKVKSELNECHALFFSSGVTLFVWTFASFTYIMTQYQYGDMFYACLTVSVCIPFITILTTLCLPKVLAIRYNSSRYESHAVVTDWRRNSSVVGPYGNIDINEYLANVNWSDVQQVESAEHFIDSLPELVLNIDIIMLLLSKKVRHCRIRNYAVHAVEQLGTTTIHLYLPQLFQALKYEPFILEKKTSALSEFLARRAKSDMEIAQRLYWSTLVELDSQELVIEVIKGVPCRSLKDKRSRPVYQCFLDEFSNTLRTSSTGSTIWSGLQQQQNVIHHIHSGYSSIMQQGTDVKSKVEILQNALKPGGELRHLACFENTVPHPLHSQILVKGIDSENCSIFRSSAKPMKLHFSIDPLAQRKLVQETMATFLAEKHRSARVSSSLAGSEISIEFDSARVDNQFAYVVTIQLRSARHLPKQTTRGAYFAHIDCNGQIKRTETLENPEWNATFQLKSGIAPKDIEIHLFFVPHESDTPSDIIATERPMLSCSSSHLLPENKKHVFIADFSIEYETLMTENDGKLEGWQISSDNIEIDLCIESKVQEIYNSTSGTQEGINFAVQSQLGNVLKSCNLSTIFKVGDDLRQDQLALQLIGIMDSIFLSHQLDLKLTQYRILATSPTSGFAEFVSDSHAMSAVLDDNNHSILEFLRKRNFDVHAENNITQEAMETYIRSCAGYCVITFVLGVGDRHLDNIMLKSTGHVFHIDFGFMFGRDPKPFPPPFRLTPEMVAAMGGMHHQNFEAFMSYAARAFNILRSSSSILLGALELMSEAGIPDMKENPTLAIAEVEQRLVLHATKFNAAQFMRGMIRHSQKSKTTARLSVMEQFHKFAVALQ